MSVVSYILSFIPSEEAEVLYYCIQESYLYWDVGTIRNR